MRRCWPAGAAPFAHTDPGPRRGRACTVPTVWEVTPTTAPISGGAIVATVRGQDFGKSDVGQKAFIGNTECLKTRWVSSTEVDCVVPPGIGHNLSVVVDVLGLSSDGNFTGFSYEGASACLALLRARSGAGRRLRRRWRQLLCRLRPARCPAGRPAAAAPPDTHPRAAGDAHRRSRTPARR